MKKQILLSVALLTTASATLFAVPSKVAVENQQLPAKLPVKTGAVGTIATLAQAKAAAAADPEGTAAAIAVFAAQICGATITGGVQPNPIVLSYLTNTPIPAGVSKQDKKLGRLKK